MRLILLVFAFIVSCSLALTLSQSVGAQVTTGPTSAPSESKSPATTSAQKDNAENSTREGPVELYRGRSYLTHPEFYLSAMTAALGLVVLLLEFFLLKRNVKADEALRMFGITIIIVGALLATTAGYSASDISPAIGLFGTVAGYLLGRGASRSEVSKDEKS